MLDIAYYLKFGFTRWQLIAIEGLQKNRYKKQTNNRTRYKKKQTNKTKPKQKN